MSEISRVALFGKLDELAYKAVESAATFCKIRGNPYVELVHWIHQIVELPDSDLKRILTEFDVDPARLARDITAALDQLPRGASSISDLSAQLEETVERAWIWASLKWGRASIRTGHLVVGALKSPSLRNALYGISGEFRKISLEKLSDGFEAIVDGSPEAALDAAAPAAVPGEASGAMAPPEMGKQEALARFTVDLTAQAASGEMDPIVGRDDEIRQVIDILMRRRQNNPILTGEAGVGKTAVVEGFAQRIASGDVPPSLENVRLLSLDVGLLQAGASMKGEFENRLRQVIDEVRSSPTPIVLFIDEAHTLVGAGGAAGTGDAANLLKPALARGTLRTVAATTWGEYKKHIEKDPALTRRFQVVKVDEPSEDKCVGMLRRMMSVMEKHHRVLVHDEAVQAAVTLSHRYIPARQLPDKAVSLLDTACARVAIGLHAIPPEVDDSRRRIEALDIEIGIIEREGSLGEPVADRRAAATSALTTERARLAELEAAWQAEKSLVDEVLALRAKLTGADEDGEAPDDAQPADAEQIRDALRERQAALEQLQGEAPLIAPGVDAQAVAKVVADWTGIPVGRMVKDEVATVLNLAQALAVRVVGQQHAHEMIASRIQTARAGLDNPSKPIGVFMLAGPSGVGKTETALALAETLYGGEQNIVTINMSEFQEAHTVSTLKGAPPGYVGYGEGGVLTEAVRRKPYSVVLLDEVEKAHPDVHEIFFQVFDKGSMEDGEGRVIDFKNTLILLTTNVGSDLIMNMCKDPDLMPDPEGIAKALRKPLLEVFPAALLGRIVTIPFYPLSAEMVGAIARLQLERIGRRLESNQGLPLEYDDDVVDLIARRCTELESGGRMIDNILTNSILPRISQEFLARLLAGDVVTRVKIGVAGDDFDYAFDAEAPAKTKARTKADPKASSKAKTR